MKRVLILVIITVGYYTQSIAQDNIKRPDSYNYQTAAEAYNQEDYQKSMEYFDKELQQNPKNGYAMLYEAYIYEKYDQYGQALTSANQSLKFLPKKDKDWVAMAYAKRAEVQAELGDTVKALADYNLAFKTSPDRQYIYDRCNLLNNQGRYDEVSIDLKRAYALDENNAVTWVYDGRNEHGKGNYDKAIDKYTYAIKLDPNYSSGFSFRADSYISIHKYKEACQDVISALNLDNDTKSFFLLYCLADSAYSQVETQLKAQQLREPTKSKWSYYLGLVRSNHHDYEGAEPAFKEALRLDSYEGDNTELINQHLAETLKELGKYEEALSATDAALAIDSTSVRTWDDRSDILYSMGNYMAAIEAETNAITFNTSSASLYYSRSRTYMYAGMNRNALDDINTAITLEPEEMRYVNSRSELYRRMGNYAEADADCKTIIDSEKGKTDKEQDTYSLAYAYARLGMKAEARLFIEKAFKDEYNFDNEYDKACMYSLIDDKATAIQHLENSLQLGYRDFVHIGNDTDLANIRDTEDFKALMNKYALTSDKQKSNTKNNVKSYKEVITEVPFTKESGIYKVKCSINGLPLHFYFDTGAADVTISSVEAQFMLKNGYLQPSDIRGKQYYGTASGEISEGTTIMLKKVDIGGLELNDVKASVVHNQQAPLLLGQTVLNRLGKIEIDYNKSVLKITSHKKN